MPLNLFYTMVQKSQKWPKTQIKGGSCLKLGFLKSLSCVLFFFSIFPWLSKPGKGTFGKFKCLIIFQIIFRTF